MDKQENGFEVEFAHSPLTRELCEIYLDREIFPVRPPRVAPGLSVDHPGSVGLEVEMLPLLSQIGKHPPLPAPLYGNTRSVAAAVERFCLGGQYTKTYQPFLHPDSQDPPEGWLYAVTVEGTERITFEPGGQLEFSSQVQDGCRALISRLNSVQKDLAKALQEEGLSLVQTGLNPWHRLSDIGLQLHQGRYQAMNTYFQDLGEYGQRMMRQTLSIQVNLDFGKNDEQLMRRYLAAQLLTPWATAIFANSPILEGQKTPWASYRAAIWRHLDSARSGLRLDWCRDVQELSRSAMVRDYLNFALAAPVIFVESAHYQRPPKGFTFADWLASGFSWQEGVLWPTLKDFRTHLSLLFPEVRPRGFLEIRAVDGPPRPFQYLPMAFFLGSLYDETALEEVLQLLGPRLHKTHEFAQRALHGLDDAEILPLARRLAEIAEQGHRRLPDYYRCPETERRFSRFRENYVERGRTPANDLREVWHAAWDVPDFRQLEEQQLRTVT